MNDKEKISILIEASEYAFKWCPGDNSEGEAPRIHEDCGCKKLQEAIKKSKGGFDNENILDR